MAQLRECRACHGDGDLIDSPWRYVVGDRPKDQRDCPACRGSGRRPDLVDMSLQRYLVAVLELNGERRRHCWSMGLVTRVADWPSGQDRDEASAVAGHDSWHLYSDEQYQEVLASFALGAFVTTEVLRAAGWRITSLQVHLEVTGPNDFVVDGDWYDAYNHALVYWRKRQAKET